MISLNAKQAMIASALTAFGASLCCVAPLVLLTLGIGGTWMATLTKFEPLRPVFVVLTLLLLGLAWRKLYRAGDVCESGGCTAETVPRPRQRLIFWVVAVPTLLLLVFPWFAPLFY